MQKTYLKEWAKAHSNSISFNYLWIYDEVKKTPNNLALAKRSWTLFDIYYVEP